MSSLKNFHRASHLLSALLLCSLASLTQAQGVVDDDTVEWFTLGSDYGHTRYTPADQITAGNFADLEVAWEWNGASFQAISGRSTPSYIDGKLFTVAGNRRHVIAIDPQSGETIWSYREPNTRRAEYSMRADYGKGVGYGYVNGKGVVYMISPGFFLTALDADTGAPLEGFGQPVPLDGFPETGVVDLLADLGHPYDPYEGIPLDVGYITSSSPPIVVNDVIIVGNSAEQGYHQSRIENVPGDILAYSASTGEFLWKFNVIPRPGEYGHETWENDAWEWTGDVSSWAPISADAENGIVYIPTNGATIDYYGGFRPGDNLFGTSLIALDVRTGERKWHFQFVHHDIWNFDTPTAPILMDVMHNGQPTPIVAQATKQAWVYVFNRLTGEPLWPIVETPVPASIVPGEVLSPTQPYVTKPAAFDLQGISENDLVDFTPALRAEAIEAMSEFVMGGLFNPPIHDTNEMGKFAAMNCPGGSGGANINAPAAADPTTGIIYVSTHTACFTLRVIPGEEADTFYPETTGRTFSQYANSGRGATARTPRLASGLPYTKPPYSQIVAIDLNTGEHSWAIPTGETPDRIKNNAALAGIDVGNTGTGALVPMVVTANLLIYSDARSDGTPMLYAIDKSNGEILAQIEAPDRSAYGMSSWMHEGRQYLMLQSGAKLIAMALPQEEPGTAAAH